MFSRFLRRFATTCPPAARRLGLAREHLDIAERHARVRAAWASHLAASRALILEVAARGARRDRALVIGAGDCLDVPVAELADLFKEVVLADIVIGREARRWTKKLPDRVRCVSWDASGALAALAAVRDTVAASDAPGYFACADPGPPPGGEADFTVSANCISQLGLVPGHSLAAYEKDEDLPERCARAAAKRHLAWLQERPGIRLLIADAARLDVGPDGRQLKRETLHERFGLPKPDRSWRWDLAPIPEWSPDFHRVHEVGAWVYAS
ncbi:MAG: hypothetical protein HYV95_09110 [Opitutae bacterium]|nr:hypothetical protein [Opitutae bacterium]